MCSNIATLLSGIISGGLTLIGVILTIRSQNKKNNEEYLRRIKPFIVIEPPCSFSGDVEKIKKLTIENDSLRESPSEDYIVYRLYEALLCNVGEAVCMINYLRIGKHKYKSFDDVPLKSNDYCEITGGPIMFYTAKGKPDIYIGVFDRLFNHYEYKVNYSVGEPNKFESMPKKYVCKTITLKNIDCR